MSDDTISVSSLTISPASIDPIEKVYLNENWQECSDIIITCNDTDLINQKSKITQFYTDKAFLAYHSVVFANMFQQYVKKETEDLIEVSIDVPTKVVHSFIRIIYGNFDSDHIHDFE